MENLIGSLGGVAALVALVYALVQFKKLLAPESPSKH